MRGKEGKREGKESGGSNGSGCLSFWVFSECHLQPRIPRPIDLNCNNLALFLSPSPGFRDKNNVEFPLQYLSRRRRSLRVYQRTNARVFWFEKFNLSENRVFQSSERNFRNFYSERERVFYTAHSREHCFRMFH